MRRLTREHSKSSSSSSSSSSGGSSRSSNRSRRREQHMRRPNTNGHPHQHHHQQQQQRPLTTDKCGAQPAQGHVLPRGTLNQPIKYNAARLQEEEEDILPIIISAPQTTKQAFGIMLPVIKSALFGGRAGRSLGDAFRRLRDSEQADNHNPPDCCYCSAQQP